MCTCFLILHIHFAYYLILQSLREQAREKNKKLIFPADRTAHWHSSLFRYAADFPAHSIGAHAAALILFHR